MIRKIKITPKYMKKLIGRMNEIDESQWVTFSKNNTGIRIREVDITREKLQMVIDRAKKNEPNWVVFKTKKMV